MRSERPVEEWPVAVRAPHRGLCGPLCVPEARERVAGDATTGSTPFPTVAEGSALDGREKQAEDGDVESPHASRAPAGARRERTMGVPHEPVVSPPANVSRPSRTPFIGDPERCGCPCGNEWFCSFISKLVGRGGFEPPSGSLRVLNGTNLSQSFVRSDLSPDSPESRVLPTRLFYLLSSLLI